MLCLALASGLVVSGFSLADKNPLHDEILQQVINLFLINTILVVGSEKLYSELEKKLPTAVKIVKVKQSGGLVSKDWSFRKGVAMQRINRYFCGGGLGVCPLEGGPLTSFPLIVSFKDLHIRRIGDVAPVAPTSALPIGSTRKSDENLKITRIELLSSVSVASSSSGISTIHVPPISLLHSVLALSSAEIDQESRIVDSPVAGFVTVSDVDEAKGRVTLIVPVPGRLARTFLIWCPSPLLKYNPSLLKEM